jgi:glutathione peroxidase
MLRALFLSFALLLAALPGAGRAAEAHVFDSIDGGRLDLRDWQGRPVLVVNTASRCGFTGQYEGLQDLQDRYGARGLVVLAVPSDDFRQELDSAAAVKDYCETVFGLTLPMTDITPVRGVGAHPFYRQVKAQTGWEPAWNFNKLLLGPDGTVLQTWGATTRPLSAPITSAIEAALD